MIQNKYLSTSIISRKIFNMGNSSSSGYLLANLQQEDYDHNQVYLEDPNHL